MRTNNKTSRSDNDSIKQSGMHPEGLEPTSEEEGHALNEILAQLLKLFRVDFSHYRRTTVLRRMARRMGLSKQEGYVAYRAFIRSHDDELHHLYDDLLLSFTEFFRDPPAFTALREKVFPELVQNRSAKRPIRLWVPGCSTGEEAYSLAISLYEFLEENNSQAPVQLFGTDLVERHVAKARMGEYPEKIRSQVGEQQLSRFFDRTRTGYKVTKHIREMCVFAVQDVTQDPPFPRIDLVSCRNVLIYFDASFQEIAIPLFHFALGPKGFLLLGSSETTGRFPDLFVPIDSKVNLYTKRTTRSKPSYRFPLSMPTKPLGLVETIPASQQHKHKECDVTQQVDQLLLDMYAPAGVLVDRSLHIRQFRGKTSRYLEPASGEASLKLSKMAAEGLMPDISVAIEETKKKRVPVQRKGIHYTNDGNSSQADITIVPVPDRTNGELCFLVLFKESAKPADKIDVAVSALDVDQGSLVNELAELREELRSTKAHLQTIIEEKDEVNQELWAANEEVQSTNEELQSVNEEMEAAKEELESSNEELLALNEELQQKNAALIEAGRMMDSFFQQTLVMLFIANMEQNKLLRVNEEVMRITARSQKDLLEMPFSELFHPDDRKATVDAMAMLSEGKPLVGYRNRHITATGNIRRFEWTAVPDPEQSLIYAMARDVTEEELAEKSLREKDFIIRSASNSIVTADLSGTVTYANAAFLETWEIEDEAELRDRAFKDFWLDHSKIEEILAALSKGEQHWRGELAAQTNRGKLLNALVSVATLFDNDDRPIGIVSTSTDITERKKSEHKLAESEAKFRSYIESAPDAIIVFDHNGRYTSVNKAACRLTGYSPNELMRVPLLDLIHPDFHKDADEHFKEVQNSGNTSGELKYIKKDGSVGSAFVDCVRLSDTQYLLFAKDITDKKLIEDRLRQAEKMQVIGQLAGGIAHDFNNQLAGILGYTEILREQTLKDPIAAKHTHNIILAVKRASDLTSQLLAFSRMGKYVNAPVDVHRVIFEVVNLLKHSIDKKIQIRQELGANPSTTTGDPSQLQSAILNLGLNARDAMPSGGELLFSTSTVQIDKEHCEKQTYEIQPGNYLKLTIADRGVGMSEATMQRIFEPFFTTKEKGKGTGMGLAAVYGTIKNHRGSIAVTSKPGKGSTFELFLPLSVEQAQDKLTSKMRKTAPKGGASILLVDDEELVRSVTEEMLLGMGHSVHAFDTGTSAIAFYLKHWQSVDMVILDMVMPGMNGQETFQSLMAINPEVKVLISSGYSIEGAAKEVLSLGAMGFIQKPYRKAVLSQKVEDILSADRPPKTV